MLRQGKRNVAAAGLAERIALTCGRAEQLPFPDASFDALTFTYLLRYVDDPQATLAELARVVKPGGRSPAWSSARRRHRPGTPPGGSTPGPLLPAGGLLTGGREWLDVGRFLGPNISAHYRKYPVGWTVDAWQRAGFTDVGTAADEPGRRPHHVGNQVRWLSRRPQARLLRGRAWPLAGLVDAAAPAVHRLAPVLRGARRDDRSAGPARPAARRAGSVLPRGRSFRARAGRTSRPAAAHGDPVVGCWSP